MARALHDDRSGDRVVAHIAATGVEEDHADAAVVAGDVVAVDRRRHGRRGEDTEGAEPGHLVAFDDHRTLGRSDADVGVDDVPRDRVAAVGVRDRVQRPDADAVRRDVVARDADASGGDREDTELASRHGVVLDRVALGADHHHTGVAVEGVAGDAVGGGPDPVEVIKLLIEKKY